MGESRDLTVIEQHELSELESTIERGIGTFMEVGAALMAIREKKLYRADYGTFEQYCRDRWGFNDRRARQLMSATRTMQNLESGTVVPEMPVSEREVRPLTRLEPDQQREAWQRAVETAPDGKITVGHVQSVVNNMLEPKPDVGYAPQEAAIDEAAPEPVAYSSPPELATELEPVAPEPTNGNRHAVHFSSESPEHYTPENIIQATLKCLGAIDLDPCSNSHENPNVPATTHYTAADDGLTQEWHGRVYMNPPYGREIPQWVEKLVWEYDEGGVTEAIALVPARTDTKWWQLLREFPVCLIIGRLKFGELEESAPFPSAVFYLGHNIDEFYYAFEHLGDIWQLVQPWMFGS